MDEDLIEDEFVADLTEEIGFDGEEGLEGDVGVAVGAVEAVGVVPEVRVCSLHDVHESLASTAVAALLFLLGTASGRAVGHSLKRQEAPCGKGIVATGAEKALEVKVLIARLDDRRLNVQ